MDRGGGPANWELGCTSNKDLVLKTSTTVSTCCKSKPVVAGKKLTVFPVCLIHLPPPTGTYKDLMNREQSCAKTKTDASAVHVGSKPDRSCSMGVSPSDSDLISDGLKGATAHGVVFSLMNTVGQ